MTDFGALTAFYLVLIIPKEWVRSPCLQMSPAVQKDPSQTQLYVSVLGVSVGRKMTR